jgi:hypothetical protein
VPPNRGDLRLKLRPGKITTYVVHDFKVIPQARFQSRGNLAFIGRQAEDPGPICVARLCPTEICAAALEPFW